MTRYLTDQEIAFNIQDPVARQTAMLNRDIAMRTPPDIQSIAERVCEILAREVDKQKAKEGEEITVPLGGVYSQGIDVGLRWATQTITRPRDWAAILSEKEDK